MVNSPKRWGGVFWLKGLKIYFIKENKFYHPSCNCLFSKVSVRLDPVPGSIGCKVGDTLARMPVHLRTQMLSPVLWTTGRQRVLGLQEEAWASGREHAGSQRHMEPAVEGSAPRDVSDVSHMDVSPCFMSWLAACACIFCPSMVVEIFHQFA